MDDSREKLLAAARDYRERAYAPYSKFAVGAAVLTAGGKIYGGCNVENASYGLTNCAERTAIQKAVSEGERELTVLAVIADTPEPCAPCGACRQVMAEFGIEEVIMGNLKGEIRATKVADLLPLAFSGDDI